MQLANLYNQADLYDAVRPLDDELATLIEDELREVSAPGRLFDPACGPGRWLARFAAGGWRVAGNDLSPDMLRLTASCVSDCLELTQRDMRALAFAHAPYDAGVEPSSVVAELDDAAFFDHLTSARDQIRPGGAYLCVLPVDDDPTLEVPEVQYRREAPLEGGRRASCEYRVLERRPRETWRMRRAIRVEEADGSESTLVDEYLLHMRPIEVVLAMAQRAGFEPAAIRCVDTGALLAPGRPFIGEALFVLRVPASASPNTTR